MTDATVSAPISCNGTVNDDNDGDVNTDVSIDAAVTPTSVIVLLVCGLPGSGKSTLVNALLQQYRCNTCSSIEPIVEKVVDTDDGRDVCTTETTVHVDAIVYDDIQSEILLRLRQEELDGIGRDIPVSFMNDMAPIISTNTPRENGDYNHTADTNAAILQSWRQTRIVAIQQLQQVLDDITAKSKTTNDCHIILLDDNFYLRSMRKQIYRTCCSHHCPTIHRDETYNELVQLYFGTVYIDTPIDVCVQRNRQRQCQNCNSNNNGVNSIS
jgi:tRNA uridine 5-carbamoylmethylation protein Kti12